MNRLIIPDEEQTSTNGKTSLRAIPLIPVCLVKSIPRIPSSKGTNLLSTATEHIVAKKEDFLDSFVLISILSMLK
jgi:hypothetical protein